MQLQVVNLLDSLSSTHYSYINTFSTRDGLPAGGTVVPVKNINGFTNQWAIQLGKTGEETAEILTISGVPSGTALNTAGTIRFDHPIDTPVYHIHYNKVIFKRSTTGTAGTATALATVDITPDNPYTQYDDTSGATTYAYKTQFYNSINGDLSAESAWFVPGGPSFYSLQSVRTRGTASIYNPSYISGPELVNGWINEWVEQMTNAALKVNQAYSAGTTQYSFGTAGLGTVTEPLFKYASKIELTTDGVRWTKSNEIATQQFSDTDTFSSLNPRHYWQGDTIFGVLPSGNAGTARMTLGQLQTQLVDEDDTLPQFLRGYTTGCIEYIQYKAYALDQKRQEANDHYKVFLKNKNDFLTEITPRDQTGVKMIDMVEGIGSEDGFYFDY